MSLLKQAAHSYVRRGWAVVPLHSWDPSGGCSCGSTEPDHAAGKHPREKLWQKRGHLSGADVEEIWTRWPNANIGLATGGPSGFFVVDIDPKNGGLESWERLVKYEPLPATRTVETGSGGLHYYFALPEDFEVTNRPGLFKGLGIDIRGNGGQVLAPPSRTNRGSYFVYADDPIAHAPNWLLDMIRPPVVNVVNAPAGSQINADPVIEVYVQRALQAEVQRVMDAENGRNNALNEATFRLGTLVGAGALGEDDVVEAMTSAGLTVGLGHEEVARTVDSGLSAGRQKPRSPWPPVARDSDVGELPLPRRRPVIQTSAPREWPKRSWDDLGNAQRVADHFSDRLRWIEQAGKWAVYSDGHWALETSKTGQGFVQKMIDELPRTEALSYSASPKMDADGNPIASERQAFLRFVDRQRMANRVMAAMTLARGIPALQATLEDYDHDPMVLNVANGELDLRTGELRPHSPSSMLMQQSPVPYIPDAPRPQWDAYLERVHPSEEMRSFLQVVTGYSLTGMMTEQKMFIHHGPQANGKSVFLEVIGEIVGDYGQVVPRQTLLVKSGEGHPADVARMVGKRFLQTSETAAGRRLDEEVVKSITGGDRQAARFMRQDFFDFKPTGKIHYVTNHLPRLTNAESIWRRVVLLGWNVVIPEPERDLGLAQRLIREESPGILAWAVEGALKWGREGLRVPITCEMARDEWRTDEDAFGDFINERLIEVPGHFTPTSYLYRDYTDWATRSGFRPLNQKDFSMSLKERGFVQDRKRIDNSPSAPRGFQNVTVRSQQVDVPLS